MHEMEKKIIHDSTMMDTLCPLILYSLFNGNKYILCIEGEKLGQSTALWQTRDGDWTIFLPWCIYYFSPYPFFINVSLLSKCILFYFTARISRQPCTAVCTSTSHNNLRPLIQATLPIHIDRLFTFLFTNSKFFLDFHTARKTTGN